ncbi:hypothetical protein BDZ94DRAFT_1167409, partial [Collybia nuda]
GNVLISTSTASCVVALTWAGIRYSWTSFHVLCPLIIGGVGLIAAVVYNVLFASHPTVSLQLRCNSKINSNTFQTPLQILSNRTSLAGSAIHALIITSVTFASPILSGVYLFPFVAVLSLAAIVQGIVISKFGCYRLVSIIGWCLMLLGIGLMVLLNPNTAIGISIPFQMITSVGFGFLYATTFSMLAPLDVTDNAAALAFPLFCRTFPQSWRISIDTSVLQNRLRSTLLSSFIQEFTSDVDITYVAIPLVQDLPEPLQSQCRQVFSNSLHLLWKILLVLCAVGLLSVSLQRDIDFHTKTDSRWGMADKKEQPVLPSQKDGEKVEGKE